MHLLGMVRNYLSTELTLLLPCTSFIDDFTVSQRFNANLDPVLGGSTLWM
jgi:hypothetical protein